MNIVKHKFLALIFILLSAPIALGQEMEDESGGGFTLKILENPGDACMEKLRSQGRKTGFQTLRNGKEVFFAIGNSDILAPKGNNAIEKANYIDSIQRAYTKAALQAKQELAKTWSQKIKSDVKSSMIEQLKTGTPPKTLLEERKKERESSLKSQQGEEGLSMFEKAKILINQKLDSMISDETRAKLEEENLEAEEAQRILEAEINNITDQSNFNSTIETSAQAEIKGMKAIFSKKSGKGICVTMAYSDTLSKQADALASKNYSILRGLKKSKPLIQQIPDHTSEEGIRQLLGKFGAAIVKDENGDLSIFSYAQAGATRSDSTSLNFAFNAATSTASAQIAQLSNETIDVYNKMQQVEIATGYANSGIKDYYSERNQDQRIAASANIQIQGISEWGRWSITNPDTGAPMVGVILYWTPSGADAANRSRAASKNSGGGSGSNSSWSEESGYSAGGSLGGDDDDDF